MFIQRLAYKKLLNEKRKREAEQQQEKSYHQSADRYDGLADKLKLDLLLADMQTAVAIKRDNVLPSVDEAALRI